MKYWRWRSTCSNPWVCTRGKKNFLCANSIKYYTGVSNHQRRGVTKSNRSSSMRIFLEAKQLIQYTSNKWANICLWQSFVLMTWSFWQMMSASWCGSSQNFKIIWTKWSWRIVLLSRSGGWEKQRSMYHHHEQKKKYIEEFIKCFNMKECNLA